MISNFQQRSEPVNDTTTDYPAATTPLTLREEEVTALLQIGRSTLRRMVAGGKFPKPMHFGKSIRYHRDDVMAHLDRMRRGN